MTAVMVMMVMTVRMMLMVIKRKYQEIPREAFALLFWGVCIVSA